MNTWLNFVREFYSKERSKDSSKCRNRVKISNVAKVYNCKKKMSMRKSKEGSNFHQMNPMHIKKNKTIRKKRN
jgi:hypothetical protein